MQGRISRKQGICILVWFATNASLSVLATKWGTLNASSSPTRSRVKSMQVVMLQKMLALCKSPFCKIDSAAMTAQQLEPPLCCFSFPTKPDIVCASPARVPTFTALPKAATFSFAPFTPPSAKPLTFEHREAAVIPSKTSVCYHSSPMIAADLMCYETLVSTLTESKQPLHYVTGWILISCCTAGLNTRRLDMMAAIIF